MSQRPLVSLAAAQAVVLGACPALGAVVVALDEALGCVTASAVVATEAVPPFANTAMDGYAVRAVDTASAPVELVVVATLAAGSVTAAIVGPGQAVRIMTGAPLPAGADAVVMVERTSTLDNGGRVAIAASAQPGDHVRRAGEDIASGQEVFPAGTALGPAHLGVLASVGLDTVAVYRRPRVGVLSTGDELVPSPAPLAPGQIRDSNRRLLLGLVAQTGCVPVDLGICPDDADRLAAAVSDGVGRCDVLLTSGGVSVGDFDFVKVVLNRLSGGVMSWMQIAIRPAKPFAFGTVAGIPVFGLPGNPVSSMVSFECLARPALRQMMGHDSLWRPTAVAVADEDFGRRPDGKLHLVRARATWDEDGRLHARSSGGQASHLLRSTALANALVLVPDGDGFAAGAMVDVWLLE